MKADKSAIHHPAQKRSYISEVLRWQLDMGADEAIADTPFNRLDQEDNSVSSSTIVASKKSSKKDNLSGTIVSRLDEQPATASTPLVSKCDDLPSLREALASFTGSSLHEGARNCVFSDGNPSARLMIIGEAPGREEDRLGLPFVGRSGKLLDRMLAAIGLSRSQENPDFGAYITNIIPWRPVGNRTPSMAETQLFMPFIRRHIELADPDIVFLLGGVAAKCVFEDSTGIVRQRGKWRKLLCDDDKARDAIASLHPAYLLRSPASKRLAWHDFLAVKARLDNGSD